MFFEGCEGNAVGKPRVALTGRDGATRHGRREREVESSEVEPVPGATAWKLVRGVSRRGGDRTTRAEHDGSGGTDAPKGETPGVDARQRRRQGTQRTSRPPRRRGGTNRGGSAAADPCFARNTARSQAGFVEGDRSSWPVTTQRCVESPLLIHPVARFNPCRPARRERSDPRIGPLASRSAQALRRGRFRHLHRDNLRHRGGVRKHGPTAEEWT
jgi:hypothetical protein